MKALNVLFFGILVVFTGLASAEVFQAPGGSITATATGAGTVQISWTAPLALDRVVRFHLVESGPNGSWTTNVPMLAGNSVTFENVCAMNEKYSSDARFQGMNDGKWLLVAPSGVRGVTLSGVEQECSDQRGCALKVSQAVIDRVCPVVATPRSK